MIKQKQHKKQKKQNSQKIQKLQNTKKLLTFSKNPPTRRISQNKDQKQNTKIKIKTFISLYLKTM